VSGGPTLAKSNDDVRCAPPMQGLPEVLLVAGSPVNCSIRS